MMGQTEQAHHELDRLQAIITRHEGHMFALRGWLLVTVGGLLAAYYTNNIEMSKPVLILALLMVVALFLFAESRHVNLVEAVVERVARLEELIADSGSTDQRWYDGPKVSEACKEGASRWWPRPGMTFQQNLPFYAMVVLVVLFATVSLPPKSLVPLQVPTAQPASK